MLRLSVGRRLALVVAFSILAVTIVVIVVLRGQAAEAQVRAGEQVESVAFPVSTFIAANLEGAADRLEDIATTLTDEQIAGELPVESDGFLSLEVVADGESSTLNASGTMLNRSQVDTVIGSTRSMDDQVAVLIGTPVPALEVSDGDAPEGSPVLLGAYDSDSVVELVAAIGEETSVNVLLAVQNSDGEIVVFAGPDAGDTDQIGTDARSIVSEVLGGQDLSLIHI